MEEVEDAAAAAFFVLADPATPADHREKALVTLLSEPRDRVTQQQETVAAGRTELTQAETSLAAERASLAADTRAADRSRTQAQQAQHRLSEERCNVLASLSALPGPIRAHLPQQPALPTAHDLEAAQAVRQKQDRHEELAERHRELRTLLQSLLAEREQLAERRRYEVTEPLHRLEAGLHRWADSARSAAELLEEGQRPALPALTAPVMQQPRRSTQPPWKRSPRGYWHPLTSMKPSHGRPWQTWLHSLPYTLTHWPPPTPASPPDPLDPELLDGLTSQAGTLRSEAARALQEEQDALSQIPHKDRLMAAIDAGQRQKAAWQTVAAHLTDGKVPGHLTDLRTRALLAHGSELLQQLSGGRLGSPTTSTSSTSQAITAAAHAPSPAAQRRRRWPGAGTAGAVQRLRSCGVRQVSGRGRPGRSPRRPAGRAARSDGITGSGRSVGLRGIYHPVRY
ncbi:hypothetical protein [Streptomyces sp. NRRL S-1022]|uniref:hypothetical protein n=1 Tax=Streptomyces sp. NRRL S-1022 TaxID=1463880 RepID=UPI00131AEBEA|nr:hypothetical protein [Streptomyces sp. NRRL S-1022]